MKELVSKYVDESKVDYLNMYSKRLNNRKIIVFTPQIDGHYIEYLHHIYESNQTKADTTYIFLIPEEFKEKFTLLMWSEQQKVIYDFLSKEECYLCVKSGRKRFYYSAKILARYIKKHGADEAIVLTLIYVMPFICFFLPFWNKCKISGIIYSLYTYFWTESSILYKLRTLITFSLFSRCKRFKTVFILNSKPGARLFNKIYKTDKFKYLTDPVNIVSNNYRDLREELLIPENGKIILHFGAMSKAKGSLQLLQALEYSSGDLDNYYFIFAGVISDAIKDDFYRVYTKIRSKNILLFDRFCDYSFISNLIYTCDAIVIPYIHSSQSSGVVAHAAYFHKPLIVLRDGFVGRIVRNYGLGICIEDSTPVNVIQGILNIDNFNFNSKCDRYVKDHTVDEFCTQILS